MKRIVLGLSMTFIVSLCMAQVPQIPVGPNGLPEPEQKQHHQMIMDHQVKLKDRKLQSCRCRTIRLADQQELVY